MMRDTLTGRGFEKHVKFLCYCAINVNMELYILNFMVKLYLELTGQEICVLFPLISKVQGILYRLMCRLFGSLSCRLPNVMSSAPARRSRKLNHC